MLSPTVMCWKDILKSFIFKLKFNTHIYFEMSFESRTLALVMVLLKHLPIYEYPYWFIKYYWLLPFRWEKPLATSCSIYLLLLIVRAILHRTRSFAYSLKVAFFDQTNVWRGTFTSCCFWSARLFCWNNITIYVKLIIVRFTFEAYEEEFFVFWVKLVAFFCWCV